MNVLVTGGGGYIGSILVGHLLGKGYHVKCMDRFFFSQEKIQKHLSNPNFELIRDDIRTFDPKILSGVNVVVDLAALSNDPLGQLFEGHTYEINYQGRLRVCTLAKQMGVSRYILSSSCSIYGFNADDCNETSAPNPISAYAKANLKAEEVLKLADDKFTVTVLRFATAFGLSPRMRFDLAVNLMTLKAFKEGAIDVLGQGMQWRPFVHVKDIAKTITSVIGSEPNVVNGQIFNVGSNDNNLKVINLAYMVREILPFEINVRIVPDDPDKRSYKVSFDKLRSKLGIDMDVSIEDGIKEIYEALKKGIIWDDPDTCTVKWYKYLLDSQALLKSVVIDDKVL